MLTSLRPQNSNRMLSSALNAWIASQRCSALAARFSRARMALTSALPCGWKYTYLISVALTPCIVAPPWLPPCQTGWRGGIMKMTPSCLPFLSQWLRSLGPLTVTVLPVPLEPGAPAPPLLLPTAVPPGPPGTEPGAPGTLPLGVVPFGPTAAAPVGPPAAFETVVEPVGAPSTSIACTASTATRGA